MHSKPFLQATDDETLAAKHEYEKVLKSHGHDALSCRADNSRFNSNVFKTDCDVAHQDYSYCGVGIHHQNSIVKESVKRAVCSGWTLLLHAKYRWPKITLSILWPFLLATAINLHNNFYLNKSGLLLIEILSGCK